MTSLALVCCCFFLSAAGHSIHESTEAKSFSILLASYLSQNNDFSTNHISIELESDAYFGLNLAILSQHLSLVGSKKTTLLPLLDANEDRQATQSTLFTTKSLLSSILVVENSTIHISSIHFKQPNPDDIRSSTSNKITASTTVHSAIIMDSAVILSYSSFEVSCGISPLLVMPSSSPTSTASSSVVILSCSLRTVDNLLGSFCLASNAETDSLRVDVSISRIRLHSSHFIGSHGVACSTESHQHFIFGRSSIASSQISNVTSSVEATTPTTTMDQQMTGSELLHVDNALYGTATASLTTSASSICLNSSVLECVNHHTQTVQNAEKTTFTVGSADDRNQYSAQTAANLFENSIFETTTPSTSFRIIEKKNVEGSFKIIGCDFKVSFGTSFVGAVNLAAETDAFPLFLLESSSVTFSSTSGTPGGDAQFILTYAFNFHLVSSNFTTPSAQHTSCTRTIITSNSLVFPTFTNCIFERQSTSGSGSCFSDSASTSVNLWTSCKFSNCAAGNDAGVAYFLNSEARFFHCEFSSNTAKQRGGVFLFAWVSFVDLSDCHFRDNEAKEVYSEKNPNLTHYRGNDICLKDASTAKVTSTTIGCTSTSSSPKVGFYQTDASNGNLTTEDTILPNPETTSLPKAAGEWWVEISGSGTDCTTSSPCSALSDALAISENTSGFNLVHVNSGVFTLAETTLMISVEFQGMGWDVNSSTFSQIKTGGMKVSGNGNVSLTSLSLHPSSPSATLVSLDSATAKIRVSNVWVEQITDHTVPLFSFTAGTATFELSVLNTISLTQTAAITLSGTATFNVRRCWFMEISRKSGNGGSVIDSSTNDLISIANSDFGRCSSSGRAGCCDFTSSGTSSEVRLSSTFFHNNLANQSTDAPVTSFGNDLAFSGFTSGKLTLDTVRSVSQPPHYLADTATSSFDAVPLNVFQYAANFPVGNRFMRGTPSSSFISFNNLMETLSASTATLQIWFFTTQSGPLKTITLTNKQFSFRNARFTLELDGNEEILLKGKSFLRVWDGSFTVPFSIQHCPFVVQDSSQLVFLITNIIFSKNQHAESFIRNSGGTVKLQETKITDIGLNFGSHSFIESTGGSVVLYGMHFFWITSSSNGAVLNAKGTTLTSSVSCFEKCSARNGGALAIEVSNSATATITHAATSTFATTFTNCRAIGESGTVETPTGKGGAIFVNGSTTNSNPLKFSTTTSNDARFENNFGGEGNDVFVTSSVFFGKTLSQISSFGGGSHSLNFRVIVEGLGIDENEQDEIQNKLLPSPKVSVNGSELDLYGNPSGKDDITCKWTSTFCATLGYGIKFLTQKALDGSAIPETIQFLHNTTYTEKSVEVSDQDVTVTGTSAKSPTQADILRSLVEIDGTMTAGSFLFEIHNQAKLKVTNLDMKSKAGCGVFELLGDGKGLELSNLAVISKDDVTHSCSLVKTSSGPVVISQSTFNTTRGSTNPAIFTTPLVAISADTESLSLVSTTFSKLQARMSPLLDLSTEGTITFDSVSFADSSRSDSNSNDTLVLVRSPCLSHTVTPLLWPNFNTASTPLLQFLAQDTSLQSDDPFFESSLLFYLLLPAAEIHAGLANGEESAHPNCGSARLRCSSLDSAFRSAFARLISTVLVDDSLTFEEHFSVSAAIMMKSSSSTVQTVTQASDGWIDIDGAAASLDLKSLSFVLSSSSKALCLFSVPQGTLSLTSCAIGKIGSTTTLGQNLVRLIDVGSNGVLSLSRTTLASLTFTHATAGTLIHLSLGSEFSLSSDCDVSSITSNGMGSIIFVETKNITSTASSSPFIFLKSKLTVPTDRQFTELERRMFVGKEGAKEESLLWSWFAHSDTEQKIFVASEGMDHDYCGLIALPCSSFEKAFVKQKSGTNKLLLNTSSALSQSLTPTFSSFTITSFISPTRQTLSVTSSGFFSLTTQSLSIESVDFEKASGSEKLASSLFVLTSSSCLSLTDVSFSSLSTADSESLIHSTSSGMMTLNTVSFSHCNEEWSEKGRVIHISKDSFSAGDVIMKAVLLTVTAGKEGTDVLLKGAGIGHLVTEESFDETFGNEADLTLLKLTQFLSEDPTTPKNSGPLAYFMFGHSAGDVAVDSSFFDHTNCGKEKLPCSSLSHGWSQLKDSSSSVVLSSATTLSSSLSTAQTSQTLKSKSSALTVTVVESGSLTVSPTHSLLLSHLDFASSKSSVSSVSFISLTDTASLSVTSCSFSAFSSSCSGSVLSGSVGGVCSVEFQSTRFVSCSSTNVEGSGVLDIALLSEASSFLLSADSSFQNCVSTGVKSDFLLLSHPTLSETVLENSLKLDWAKDSSTATQFVGKEGSFLPLVPLFLYFTAMESTGHLDSKWSDLSVCGLSDYPCKSLPSLWKRFGDKTDVTIEVKGDVIQVEPMELNKNVRLNGGEHTLTINERESTRNTDSGLFGVNMEAEVNSIKVEIDALKSESLFDCLPSSLLTLKDSSVTQLITSIAGCLICVKEGANLVVTNTSFFSASSTHSLAGVIVANVLEGCSFKLDNVTFSSYSCSGRSHCVWMELVNTTSSPSFDYSMTDLTFVETSAHTQNTTESTTGIDVYLLGSDLDSMIEADLWEGSWDRLKERSIWADDSKSGVNSSILPYLVDIAESVEVDESGWPFLKCGHFFLFCETLHFGLGRMKSANLGSMTIINSAPLETTLEAKGVFSIVGKTSLSELSLSDAGRIEVVRDGSSESHLTLDTLSLLFSSTRLSSSFIASTQCSLSLLACSLSSPSSTVLSVSLLEMSAGSLNMNGVTSSSIRTTTSLFSTSSCVMIESCSFEHVSRSSDGPSILVASLSDTQHVSMKNTKMVGSLSNGKAQWVLLKGVDSLSEKDESWAGTFNTSCDYSSVMIERDPLTLAFDSSFNPFSLLYCFHSRTESEIVVDTTSTSVDHPLCGNVKLPCRTVDTGFGLTKENTVKISGNGELGSKMEFDGIDVSVSSLRHSGSLLVVGKGQIVNGESNGLDYLTIIELVVNLDGSTLTSDEGVFENRGGILVLKESNVTRNKKIESAVVKVIGGKVNISSTNFLSLSSSCPLVYLSSFESSQLEHVSVSDWTGSTFLSASNGKSLLTLRDCVFDGVLGRSEWNGEELCSWSSGMMKLTNTSTKVFGTTFTQLATGALVVDGGSVSLHTSAFEDNSIAHSLFPSFHRNIACSNKSTIEIMSLSGGDGTKDGPSAWISSSDCTLTSAIVNVDAPLFIPTLAEKECSSSKDRKTGVFSISLKGTTLIPCSLMLEIFSKGNESDSTVVDLSSASTTFWNETHLNLTLSLTRHLSRLTEANEWRGRLKYGNGLVTSDFLVKETAASEKKALTKEAMKTMIPIIIGVVVTLLVIFLLVIVLLCRRHKKAKANKETQKETEELNQVEIKIDEEFGFNHFEQSANVIKANSALTFSDNDTLSTNQEKKRPTASIDPLLDPEEPIEPVKQTLKAVVIRDEKVGEVNVIVRESLYHRLHRQQNTFNPMPMDKTAVKQKITRGLVLLAREKPHSEILSKLTSHRVLFDANDDILFRLETPKDVATISQPQMAGGEKGEVRQNEEQRWVPPEEADGKEIVDARHGTVFRLGLVLWEIETGLVPFGEIDAINAQRQLKSGILPKMDRVSPEMAELIENCLQIDPLKRPTLASISQHFNGKTKDDGGETEKKSDGNDIVLHP
ncbi:hypothetical protein BLNAU_18108 [Blattamonas nauphoetae]|uniref:Protein kinase domain-containing protein n=1 Tax=Blattamonas nauphoetae TaxID=2049346 RepID=A0ABQ9X5I1_9EUKA|nr:hypothetical protein BLNAU_18108 [Blattamonas nauphoetae]